MKTQLLQIKKQCMLVVNMTLLLVSFFSFSTKAQEGQNDASFNKADKVSGQGTNGTIKVSAVQADNKIIIAGNFTSYNGVTVNQIARLDMDGKLDKSFKTGTGVDGEINALIIQSNGKVIIGGNFTTYNGNTTNKITRLNKNGGIDNTFNTGEGPNGSVSQIIIQPNGKILVSGSFTQYNGEEVRGVVRLNKNGTIDHTFEAVITDSLYIIQQIALLPDGKLLVAGIDDSSWLIQYSVIRLYANGDRDYTFTRSSRITGDLHPAINAIKIEDNGNILLSVTIYDSGSSVPYHGFLSRLDSAGNELELLGLFWINSLHIQPDGKIIAAGFKDIDWYDVEKRVVRINKDFSIDSTFVFNDNKPYPSALNASIETSAFQIDNKLIIAGDFYEINGFISNNIARLNPDGSYDHTFNQHTGFNGTVLATAVNNNKRLLVGGEFSRYNYQFRSNIVRLKENGDLDNSFNVGSGTDGKVNTIAVQSNGKVLIGGKFTTYNGTLCGNVARLNTDGSLDTNFTINTDGEVRKIIIDKDGRSIIAGDFENVNGSARRSVARVKLNGSLDETFNPTIDAYGRVYDCKISSRGKIYLAVIYEEGLYSFGTDIYCLNKNGSRDLSFNIPTDYFRKINTLAFNNDNKLLAGGLTYLPTRFYNPGVVVQFNADGSIDSTFNFTEVSNALNGNVRTIDVLENDRILIGGEFTSNEYTTVNHIGLLNQDGSLNTDFLGSAGNNIFATKPVRNDKVIIGGAFSEYATVVRNGIARINVEENVQQKRIQAMPLVQTPNTLQLQVYPNPATSVITIDQQLSGSMLRIYNAIGKEMYAEQVIGSSSTIELSDYSNGIYFIISENKGTQSVSKFVVNK